MTTPQLEMRHTASERIASVASSLATWLFAFLPTILHIWLLRIVIYLPGLDSDLSELIRAYISGQTDIRAALLVNIDSEATCVDTSISAPASAHRHTTPYYTQHDLLDTAGAAHWTTASARRSRSIATADLLPAEPRSSIEPRGVFYPSNRNTDNNLTDHQNMVDDVIASLAPWDNSGDDVDGCEGVVAETDRAASLGSRLLFGFGNYAATLEGLDIPPPLPLQPTSLAIISSSSRYEDIVSREPVLGTYFSGPSSPQLYHTSLIHTQHNCQSGSAPVLQEDDCEVDGGLGFEELSSKLFTSANRNGMGIVVLRQSDLETMDKYDICTPAGLRYAERVWLAEADQTPSSPELTSSSDSGSLDPVFDDPEKENITLFPCDSSASVKINIQLDGASAPQELLHFGGSGSDVLHGGLPRSFRPYNCPSAPPLDSASDTASCPDTHSQNEGPLLLQAPTPALRLSLFSEPSANGDPSDDLATSGSNAIGKAFLGSDSYTRVNDDDNCHISSTGWEADFGSDAHEYLGTEVRCVRYYEPPEDVKILQPSPHVGPRPSAIPLMDGENTYWISRRIGKGGYGNVYLAEADLPGFGPTELAIKVVQKANAYGSGERGRKLLFSELLYWQKVTESDLPFLARLYRCFDDDLNVYFVMRLYSQTLEERMRLGPKLGREEVRLYAAEMVAALDGLHSLKIMHRDIKPGNMLLGPDGHLALADFGLSYTPVNPRGRLSFHQCHSWDRVGTPGYWAPEVRVFDSQKGAKPSSDIYSLGIVILEMALGERQPFFAGTSPTEIDQATATKPIPYDELREQDPDLADLIQKMLGTTLPPEKPNRWDTKALKGHPFFRGMFDTGLAFGSHTPKYRPWVPFPPDVCTLNFEELFTRPPSTTNLSEDMKLQLEESFDKYIMLRKEDAKKKTFQYTCPTDRQHLALQGWPTVKCQI